MNGTAKENRKWYVLRCAGKQELKLRYELERFKFECFVPLLRRKKLRGTRRVIELYPAVAGVVFALLSEEELEKFRDSSKIRFFPWKDCATDSYIIVSDREMRNFIGVTGTDNEQLIYLEPNPVNWKKGQKVRVIAGPLKGYEGRFVRIKGDRRIVVEIPGIIAVATGFIHPSFVESIPEEE